MCLSDIRNRKVSLSGAGVLQSTVGHVPDFLQCWVNIFISLAFRSPVLNLVDNEGGRWG